MPPKIEEVTKVEKDATTAKRNPFLNPKKKQTVKRDAKDVYGTESLRKGLNKPDYIKGTPLDKLFLELEDKLQGSIDEITLETLADCLLLDKQNFQGDTFIIRLEVTAKLLDYLLQIQQFSNTQHGLAKDLIGISLHDIKTFSKLINLIIIHGIYPALNTFKIGIPLAKRRLKDFMKTKKPVKLETVPQITGAKTYTDRFANSYKLLCLLYDKLKLVFQTDSDVKDLLIKGTGYSDFLTISITLITCPYFPADRKSVYLKEFQNFVIYLPGTFELFQTFSLLIASQSPPYFKQFVLKHLQTLHYNAPKEDGLLTLIEFVLGLRDNEEINIEKFDNAANVVLLKPKDIPTKEYFTKIGTQAFDLLVNINRPNVTSCMGHIIERLWVKNQLVVKDFFLKPIWDNLNPPLEQKNPDGVITPEKKFNDTINVLISLTQKGLSSELSQFLFKPILLPLWAYLVFLRRHKKNLEILINIFVGYFVSVKELEDFENDIYGLDKITKNLVYDGNQWEFQMGPNDLPQIIEKSFDFGQDKDSKINQYLANLDSSCESFIELLKFLDDTFVLKVFKQLLRRWLKLGSENNTLGPNEENPFFILIDLRLVESIGNNFKNDIAKTPNDILEIVDEFLSVKYPSKKNKSNLVMQDSDDDDSDDEDDFDSSINAEAMPVLFELLSAVLSEISSSNMTKQIRGILETIHKKLITLVESSQDSTVQSNSDAIKSLGSRIKSMLAGEPVSSSERELHAKTLDRALASLNDPLVPIRAHGLYLLRQLIESKSDLLSIEFAIKLHLIQLKDTEPFVYLNVIKGLESLIEVNDLEVVNILVKIYSNQSGKHDIDERLKIGEVLLRYVQTSNELFGGQVSEMVVNTTLSMIRRYEDESKNQDIRIRMSSMSLLGTCCKVNPLGMVSYLNDALDCAIGILQLETYEDCAVMRRSAVVLIHDLVIGTSNTSDVPFPDEYKQKVLNILSYVLDHDNDLLTRDQAQTVLDDIEMLVKAAYETFTE